MQEALKKRNDSGEVLLQASDLMRIFGRSQGCLNQWLSYRGLKNYSHKVKRPNPRRPTKHGPGISQYAVFTPSAVLQWLKTTGATILSAQEYEAALERLRPYLEQEARSDDSPRLKPGG